MKETSASFCMLLILTTMGTAHAQTQFSTQQVHLSGCAGRIYSALEIPKNQRAKITSMPAPMMTQEALRHDVHGRVVLEAILCRTGKVTDLKVIEGLPYGMTEVTIQAVFDVKFSPAEMNWHSVSQRKRFEYGFNERPAIGNKVAAGRLVEGIEVQGNRRLSASDIMRIIKSRPGERYDEDQVQQDLASILSTGYFNSLLSSVITDAGVRGGVVITFDVQELLLISEVKFHGLEDLAESVLFDALLTQNIDLQKGVVYDPGKAKIAARVIKNLLEKNRRESVQVEAQTEQVSATEVVLTFVISRYQVGTGCMD